MRTILTWLPSFAVVVAKSGPLWTTTVMSSGVSMVSTSLNTSKFTAPVAGLYTFGATCLYKVNSSTSARMQARLLKNGTDVIPGSFGGITGAHVSEVTALWLNVAVVLADIQPGPIQIVGTGSTESVDIPGLSQVLQIDSLGSFAGSIDLYARQHGVSYREAARDHAHQASIVQHGQLVDVVLLHQPHRLLDDQFHSARLQGTTKDRWSRIATPLVDSGDVNR